MKPRTGATLTEVLVAIFVMGIGMMALLTLFPIGILTMQQAIQDDRTAHAVSSAAAIAQARYLREDPRLKDTATGKWFFDHPDPAGTSGYTFVTPPPADGPSYPVYFDPWGVYSYTPGSPASQWVGGVPGGVARRPDFGSTNAAEALKWFSSLDDILFDKEAAPADLDGNPAIKEFERKIEYTWAYLLRRPMNGRPGIVDMSVVVYNGRPLSLSQDLQTGETAYSANFDVVNSTIVVTNAAAKPPSIKVGQWALDCTPNVQGTNYLPGHANFYRVVSVTQTAQNQVAIEVQQPIRDFAAAASPGPAGYIVVMDGVAEVFHVGPGRTPAAP